MSAGRLDLAFAASFWAALAGGSLLLVSFFLPLPAALLSFAWFLFFASLAATFALAVIASRREARGVARALFDGIRTSLAWVAAFLP